MQDNIITLPVDVLNNGTTTDRVYERFSVDSPNKVTYTGPDHTATARDVLQLYRTFAKRTGVYLGSNKSTVKFTEDKVVLTAEGLNTVAPLIADVSFSIPVGVSVADQLAFRQRLIAALDHAFMVSFNGVLEI